MKFIFAVAIAIAPCAANAAPVYLKCHLNPGPGVVAKTFVEVTLNEEAMKVTYVFPEIARSFTVPGVFTADKVSFKGFSIDRTNFAFTRDLSHLQAPGRAPIIDYGLCALADVKRAF